MTKLNKSDLLILKDLARRFYLEISDSQKISDSAEPLSHGDKLAIAFFEASTRLLSKKGLDPIDTSFSLEVPDSDPEAEYSDWISEESAD